LDGILTALPRSVVIVLSNSVSYIGFYTEGPVRVGSCPCGAANNALQPEKIHRQLTDSLQTVEI